MSCKWWFCEGKELKNSPDIQICCENEELHRLIIPEAFEDDTGRYCCLASNCVGSDSTSAEVFVEGTSSSDSDSEIFSSNSGAMPQAQKKSTSVSLTIGSSAPKAGITTAVIQPISVPNQQVQSPTSYLYRLDESKPSHAVPIFTKELQNATTTEGQVVVLECRVRGPPPMQVSWFRQGTEIQDSPDFRVLQKKPRSAAEPGKHLVKERPFCSLTLCVCTKAKQCNVSAANWTHYRAIPSFSMKVTSEAVKYMALVPAPAFSPVSTLLAS
uniref:Uncharacterized protein n=1 Tax=Sphaerodactylus townsendi TaxID=933632 RepID=A0ACB8E7Q5_9SAUR